MKIHHLNCGTLCPGNALLINGRGSLLERGRLICHCLLIETSQGLVLVDTGFGLQDIDSPNRLGLMFNWLARPRLSRAESARVQVEALGYKAEDVRHIVVTHLDVDHAGGLADFPSARIHVHARELKAARQRLSLHDRLRYMPHQWKHDTFWETYREEGDRWYGFEAVTELKGLEGEEIGLIPLPGHSRGHCAVAVGKGAGWLLHCGDAYFQREQLTRDLQNCAPGLALFQAVDQWNLLMWGHNLLRLQQLAAQHSDEIEFICSHDPSDLARHS